MTKIVNSWTEFQPLKRVIVGRPEGTQVFAPEPGAQLDMPRSDFPLGTYGKFPQELVDAANEQMDYFIEKLEERGVIVGTPDWTAMNFRGTNCPRDLFMPVGNEIIEAPACCAPAGTNTSVCARSSSSTSKRIRISCGLLLPSRASRMSPM